MNQSIRWISMIAVVLLTTIVGCGPSDVKPVSGVVTLDGEPLVGAWVVFTPLEGEKKTSSRGKTDESGKYELRFTSDTQGALLGKQMVQIYYEPGLDDTVQKRKDKDSQVSKLPKTFYEDSELRAEVTAGGDNKFNFDLKSD